MIALVYSTNRHVFATLLLFLGVAVVGCSRKDAQPTDLVSEPTSTESRTLASVAAEPATESSPTAEPPTEASDASVPLSIAGLPVARVDVSLREETAKVDPARDGWDTETFNEHALAQLKKLAAWLESSEQGPLPAIFSDELSMSGLRPRDLTPVLNESGYVVSRWQGATIAPVVVSDAERGAWFRQLLSADAEHVHAEFKIIGIASEDGLPTTRVRFHLSASNAAARVQQNAGWLCRWVGADSELPRLQSVQLTEFEEVVGPATPLFADRTASLFAGVPSFATQLAYPLDHWRDRVDWRFGWTVVGNHGLAVGDVNGDGLEDVYVAETGGLPNRLLVQQADGTLRDISRQAGVDILEPSHGALLVDLDNDGDQDLVVAVARYILVFENDGNARFTEHPTLESRSMMRSLTAADHDSDGLLDLYACGYNLRNGDSIGLGRPLPYHDANNGAPSYLMLNEGGFRFRDATQELGLDENNRRFSYAAAWEDYDNDGDLDLYVANDFGRNNLYRNDGTRFVDVAAEAGVEDVAAGMSVSWGDYNRDGRPDLYVSNMFSSAGNRIAYQRQFKTNDDDATRALYQRHARGNSLFENMGDGTFRDVSEAAAVTEGRWAWGSLFADLNSDGWEDLVVANGMVTGTEDTGDL